MSVWWTYDSSRVSSFCDANFTSLWAVMCATSLQLVDVMQIRVLITSVATATCNETRLSNRYSKCDANNFLFLFYQVDKVAIKSENMNHFLLSLIVFHASIITMISAWVDDAPPWSRTYFSEDTVLLVLVRGTTTPASLWIRRLST